MAGSLSRGDLLTSVLRWFARGIGLIANLFFLLIGIGKALSPTAPLSVEIVPVIILIGTCVIGYIILSWWREGIGGALIFVAGLILGSYVFFAAGRNKLLVASIYGYGSPYLVVGGLFGVYWLRSRR